MELPHIHIQGADGEEIDSYTAAIELANTCREYYANRLKVVQERKEKLLIPHKAKSMRNQPKTRHNSDVMEHERKFSNTSIDELMEKLKQEMASLMDQDLDLMKQLLMLNDQIEELKWRKRYSDKTPLLSSCDLNTSESSITEYDPDNNTPVQSATYLPDKYPSPSSLSLCKDETSATSRDLLDEKVEKAKVTFKMPSATKRQHSMPHGVGLSSQSGTTRQISYHSAQKEPILSLQSGYSGALSPHIGGGIRLPVINNLSDDETLKRHDNIEQQSFDSGFNEGDHEPTELSVVQKRIASVHEKHRKFISGSHKVTTL